MKKESLGRMLSVAVVCVAAGAGAGIAPGFVEVNWSEAAGETWTVKGLADFETRRPMARDTVFSICSNTKPITSVLVLTFVEEGVLDLDDPVARYLPEFASIEVRGENRPPKRPVTLRHLLTHLSGLKFEVSNPGVKSDMTPYLDQVKLAVEAGLGIDPGESYRYTSLGFQMIGAILEKVTGRKASDLMRERIFEPLGMSDTTFYPGAALTARLAQPYYYPPDGATPIRYGVDGRFTTPLDNPSRTAMLSGGLFSTVGDYLKFSQMMVRKGIGLNGRRILLEKTFDDYLLRRQTPLGDKVDASFDVHFNHDHTSGSKGGLFATDAEWNWKSRCCRVTFRAMSPYAPEGLKSSLDARGFGGEKTVFRISEKKIVDGLVGCVVCNDDDRHGVATVELVVNGVAVESKRVDLSIGESKRVEFVHVVGSDAKIELRLK